VSNGSSFGLIECDDGSSASCWSGSGGCVVGGCVDMCDDEWWVGALTCVMMSGGVVVGGCVDMCDDEWWGCVGWVR
jgi:hypothetical protein